MAMMYFKINGHPIPFQLKLSSTAVGVGKIQIDWMTGILLGNHHLGPSRVNADEPYVNCCAFYYRPVSLTVLHVKVPVICL